MSRGNNNNQQAKDVVKRVLYQGHKLRSAIVKSILDYDTNELLQQHSQHKGFTSNSSCKTFHALPTKENTQTSARSSSNSHCNICTIYEKELSAETAKENQPPTVPFLPLSQLNEPCNTTFVQPGPSHVHTVCEKPEAPASDRLPPQASSPIAKYLQYVNSVKIIIHGVQLNQAGNRKVTASRIDQKYKLPLSITHMYFVKYTLPKQLQEVRRATREGRINSADDEVRICSKKILNEGVQFNQTFFHDVANVDRLNLKQLNLTFEISCRTLKQKNTNVLGKCTFNFHTLELTKYLCCTKELAIRDKAIVLGVLKVSVYLGSDKLYFAREFVDFFYLNRQDEKTSCDEVPLDPISNFTSRHNNTTNELGSAECIATTPDLLHGLLFVSEAEYWQNPINSYLSCQLFCEGDAVCSRVVYNSHIPVFNFSQKVPFLYDDHFLQLMQNSMVVDFWERKHAEDILIGTTSINLHAFHIAYRNRSIAKSLFNKKLPIIVSDWWELITNPTNGNVYGQVKVLVALGTDVQIQNLEVERGLRNETLSVTYVPVCHNKSDTAKPRIQRPKLLQTSSEPKLTPTTDRQLQKVDIGVQSETDYTATMDEENNERTQRLLETLLTQLATQRQQNRVETATNTDCDLQSHARETVSSTSLDESRQSTNLQIKRTADLLDELNGALGFAVAKPLSPTAQTRTEEATFGARVMVAEALHLPGRKKKSKKQRRKEDGARGTYVTFETTQGAFKVTEIVPQLANPRWNYECDDVALPVELLHNNQKRLIFKVWRKAGTGHLSPNPQTDEIVGFAACDLTVLASGLPSIDGWYNVVDFENKCKGQIKIAVTPNEKVAKTNHETPPLRPLVQPENVRRAHAPTRPHTTTRADDEATSELLNRALKRKFTELDEITQRLRARLADVTHDDSDVEGNVADELSAQFENDINTCAHEPDDAATEADSLLWYNAVEEPTLERRKFDQPLHVTLPFAPGIPQALPAAASESHLIREKQHIDTLLEKLTILSNAENAFVGRYVSGCSTKQDDADDETAANAAKENVFSASLFQQLCAVPLDPPTDVKGAGTSSESSEHSLVTQFSLFRKAPEGTSVDGSAHRQT